MQRLTFLPAIDLVDGQAARLTKGEAGTEKTYGDPLEVVEEFTRQGATWLHLVDLDAAFGRGSNSDLVREMVLANPALMIETSGGLRDDATLERVLEAGVQRVNLGTAAIENPQWCAEVIKRFSSRIAVGLDVRGERVCVRGWVSEGPSLSEILMRLDELGCSRYVVTDVSKDGTLSGPNLELLKSVCRQTPAKIIASGGVSSLKDLTELRKLSAQCPNLEGVIVGKALYERCFSVAQALEVLEAE